ncbi:MAG TPA: DedA family protein [Vicinamibacterales bacterium]|nr:DedA family protein [Vicinamibacterales bacterium]
MTHFLVSAGYAAVFVLSFISSMGLPVGSELAIVGGGALATGKVTGQGEPLNLAVVIILATLGEVLGSAAGYAIGRYGGRPLVDRVGKYVLLTHKDLDRAEAWFARRGEPVVFFGRFIPLLRSFVSFAAGLGEMAIGKFLLFTVIACAIWCSALASIGYGLAGTYDQVVKGFSYAGYVLVALAVVAVAVVFWHRYRSYKAEQVQGRHERQA